MAKRNWISSLAMTLKNARGAESQASLAARSGISDRTISDIEQKKLTDPPRPTTLARLAIATGKDPHSWASIVDKSISEDAVSQLESEILHTTKRSASSLKAKFFTLAENDSARVEKKLSQFLSEVSVFQILQGPLANKILITVIYYS